MSQTATQIENRFDANFENYTSFNNGIYNAFTFPKTPVITNDHPNTISLYNWGLIPNFAKDTDIRRFTLNARIETINVKPSFRNSTKNRCLVLIDGFYEWQWLDEKGKRKQKYLIKLDNDGQPFALAGIFNRWRDYKNNLTINSYSVLTMKANSQMKKIHNSKKRMPIILNQQTEKLWLLDDLPTLPDIDLITIKI